MVCDEFPTMVICECWAGLSDIVVMCFQPWSDISAECHSLNGGTWLVTRNFSLGLKLSLSVEIPFSRRMEAPGQIPGILVWD